SPTRSPVFLGSSDGSTGFDPISCLGCHGRSEGAAGVTGAGLRQHHFANAVTSCAGCHPDDSDPGAFTTVGEDVLPPYYTTLAMDPCNPAGEEDFAATAIGLDNDGDKLYDQNDTDCQAVVLAPDINLSPGTLDFGAVAAGNMATLDTAIQNLGTADLNVSAISLCTGTSTEFTWTPTAPFVVAPSASQTLSVTYTPVDDGIDQGCLEISSDDPDEAVKQLPLNQGGSIIQFIPAFIKPKPEEPAPAQ
ncbi:MAG TPA: choice-of-anchor D domain-containing protein, partial [Desulfobacteraceae bacterium]|nr:choice-of-anchor D domain-containing protein [Desulfobacteraceae bacterium]